MLVVAPLVLTAGATTATAAAATQPKQAAPQVELGTAKAVVTDDTYIDPKRNGAVWGSAPAMTAKVDGDKHAFVKFAVSNVPAGAEITAATLHVERSDTHHLTNIAVGRASTNWTEETATWANAPVTGARLDLATSKDKGISVNLDVTKAVTGNGPVAFTLGTGAASDWAHLKTKESGDPATLTVSWRREVGAATPAPTAPVSPAPSATPTKPATPKPTASASRSAAPAPAPKPSATVTAQPTVTPTVSADPTPAPAPPTSSGGTLFGSDVSMDPGESRADAFKRLQKENGKMEMVRVYESGVPSSFAKLSETYGNTPLNISFKLDPRQVISGKYDAAMTAWFKSAPTNRPTWWTYYHEPEDNIAAGQFTAADYRAAWQHLSSLDDSAHNANLHATLCLMAWTVDPGSHRNWRDYYPGDAAIDTFAWDSYNNAATSAKGRYKDASELFDRAYAVTTSVHKTFAIAEFGSALAKGDDGSQRAAWLKTIGSYARAHKAAYIALFDSGVGGDYRITDSKSRQGWKDATLAG